MRLSFIDIDDFRALVTGIDTMYAYYDFFEVGHDLDPFGVITEVEFKDSNSLVYLRTGTAMEHDNLVKTLVEKGAAITNFRGVCVDAGLDDVTLYRELCEGFNMPENQEVIDALTKQNSQSSVSDLSAFSLD